MQTFLPYSDFTKSFSCLDARRARKQCVECKQILNIILERITLKKKGWRNHPAVLMWVGYAPALQEYYNVFFDNCKSVHKTKFVKLKREIITNEIVYPPWLGNEELHESHRCNLWRKATTQDVEQEYTLLYDILKDDPDFNNCDIAKDYVWPVRIEKKPKRRKVT